jgi:mannosyl-oligosaccharide alpha-1,2-mannosidase
MGLTDEFEQGRKWVQTQFTSYPGGSTVHVFEDNIRILGGLLSAYELTSDKMFLNRAKTVGDVLESAFKFGRDIPCGEIYDPKWMGGKNKDVCTVPYGATHPYTAEVGTLVRRWDAPNGPG